MKTDRMRKRVRKDAEPSFAILNKYSLEDMDLLHDIVGLGPEWKLSARRKELQAELRRRDYEFHTRMMTEAFRTAAAYPGLMIIPQDEMKAEYLEDDGAVRCPEIIYHPPEPRRRWWGGKR